MAVFCCFGVCIPYSVFWPLVVIALREVWAFFFGKSTKKEDKVDNKEAAECSSDSCCSQGGGHLGYLTNDMDWNKLIKDSNVLFVKFTAKWCKPCKEMDPLIEKLAEENKEKASFINVDVDEFDELSAENGALSIPHIVCYRGGERADSLSGKRDEDSLRSFINKHL
eukprot:gene10375-11291_t